LFSDLFFTGRSATVQMLETLHDAVEEGCPPGVSYVHVQKLEDIFESAEELATAKRREVELMLAAQKQKRLLAGNGPPEFAFVDLISGAPSKNAQSYSNTPTYNQVVAASLNAAGLAWHTLNVPSFSSTLHEMTLDLVQPRFLFLLSQAFDFSAAPCSCFQRFVSGAAGVNGYNQPIDSADTWCQSSEEQVCVDQCVD